MQNIFKKSFAFVVALVICVCQLGITSFDNLFGSIKANATIKYTDDYDEFLNALGALESGNNYGLSGNGYYGRWMIGKYGLEDAGLMTKGGAWTSKAAQFGVYSYADFCRSVACQDYAILVLHKKNWSYLIQNGAAKHVGETVGGVKVTVAGLIGASHLLGAWGVLDVFRGARAVDGNGVSGLSYMKKLGGYNIEKTIKGQNTVQSAPKAATKPAPVVTTTTNTTTTVTTTTTTTTTYDPSLVEAYGDIDDSGKIDSVDATYVLVYYAKWLLDDTLTLPEFMEDELAKMSIDEESTEDVTEDNTDDTNVSDSEDTTESVEKNVDVNNNKASQDKVESETETETKVVVPSKGDINGDGRIDAQDATIILVYYAGKMLESTDDTPKTTDTSGSDGKTSTTTTIANAPVSKD